MTDANKLLIVNHRYTGQVTRINNCARQTTYNGKIVNVHEIYIKFDITPTVETLCSHVEDSPETSYYKRGEYVEVTIRNYVNKNYSIHKNTDFDGFVPPPATSQQDVPAEIESADFFIPSRMLTADQINLQWQTAIMGAATYCQYKPETSKTDFLSMARELFNMQNEPSKSV
jgi:hypothetical protein